MAATTAADQLKQEEMESACSVLLFVRGFAIAELAGTIERESNGKGEHDVSMCGSLRPHWVVQG